MAKKNSRKKYVSLEYITGRYDEVLFDTCAIDGYNNSIKNIRFLYEAFRGGSVFAIISAVKNEILNNNFKFGLIRGGKMKNWAIREDLVALLDENGSVRDDPDKICSYVERKLTPVDAAVFSAGYYSALDNNKSAIVTNDEPIINIWKNSMTDGFMLDRGIGIHDFSVFKRRQKDGYKKIYP